MAVDLSFPGVDAGQCGASSRSEKACGRESLRQFVSGKIVNFIMTFQEIPCRRADLGNPYCRERQSSVDDRERRAAGDRTIFYCAIAISDSMSTRYRYYGCSI